jgi:hypothetical protein
VLGGGIGTKRIGGFDVRMKLWCECRFDMQTEVELTREVGGSRLGFKIGGYTIHE